MSAVRAGGPGGQNVNKVSSAVHLRFDIGASSLPEAVKEKLLALSDRRITTRGVVIIKSSIHRTQEKNKQEALSRLRSLIHKAVQVRKKRKATRPSKGAKERRLASKNKNSRQKTLRGRVNDDS